MRFSAYVSHLSGISRIERTVALTVTPTRTAGGRRSPRIERTVALTVTPAVC